MLNKVIILLWLSAFCLTMVIANCSRSEEKSANIRDTQSPILLWNAC